MELRTFIQERQFSFHRIETLVYLLILSSSFLLLAVFPYIHTYYVSWALDLSIYLLIQILLVVIWHVNRTRFPKPGKKFQIVVAITTENLKQKERISFDYIEQIKTRLREYHLDQSFGVTVLHNHLSKTLTDRIVSFTHAQKAGLTKSNDYLAFQKLGKRLNAKFIIFGTLINRNVEDKTYCLNLHAILLHKPTNKIAKDGLSFEFNALWRSEIRFLENDELTEFRANAEQMFFTSSYMIGLASLVDNNYEIAAKIYENLLQYTTIKPDLKEYKNKLHRLLVATYHLHSRYYYHLGDYKKSNEIRDKLVAFSPKEFDSLIHNSIKCITEQNNPTLALEYVNKARLFSNGNPVWMYNKFYILLALNICHEAIAVLDDILSQSHHLEEKIIEDVIIFNQNCLKIDDNHIQSHFILGCFQYKKKDLKVPAYENFDLFLQKSTDPLHEPVRKRAKLYLDEIAGFLNS